jgi:hypothetical protein
MSAHESKDACCSSAYRTKAAYFFGALVVILLGLGLNSMLKHYTATGAQTAREARSLERSKAQAELRQLTAQELTSSAVLDRSKGIHRIPVTAAMEITLKEYQADAAAGRSNFVSRVENWAKPPVLE